jgi:hypothetical protein
VCKIEKVIIMKTNPLLRNDRNIWLTVAAIFSGCALASSANAQLTISDSATAPTADILTSQLTDDTSDDLGPGHDGNRDYMNNNGTVGQTFTLGASSTLDDIVIKGRGDSAMFYSGGAQPFVAGVVWGIQICSVGAGGALTPLYTDSSDTYVPSNGGADEENYLTYDLATPLSLAAGVYAFNVSIDDNGVNVVGPPANTGAAGQSWFGLAHSTGDAYAGGTAENSDLSDVNTPGNGNGQGTYGAYAAPNPGGYDYVFAAIGTVPEPTTLALIGLGGLGLLAAKRRKV